MNLTINEKTYELKLGYRFSNALDRVYTIKQDMGNGQDVELGVGVQFLYSYLAMGNFDAVIKFYTYGLNHLKQRPNENSIVDAVEEMAAIKGIEQLAEECIEGLRASGFYKRLFKDQSEQTKKKA